MVCCCQFDTISALCRIQGLDCVVEGFYVGCDGLEGDCVVFVCDPPLWGQHAVFFQHVTDCEDPGVGIGRFYTLRTPISQDFSNQVHIELLVVAAIDEQDLVRVSTLTGTCQHPQIDWYGSTTNHPWRKRYHSFNGAAFEHIRPNRGLRTAAESSTCWLQYKRSALRPQVPYRYLQPCCIKTRLG